MIFHVRGIKNLLNGPIHFFIMETTKFPVLVVFLHMIITYMCLYIHIIFPTRTIYLIKS